MSESRTYNLGTVTIEQLGQAVEAFLRGQNSMQVEGLHGSGGYMVQARQNSGEWRKFVGLDKAVQVRILPSGDRSVVVSVGEGKWVDKLGVGAVGALFFAPLMIVAGAGAVLQVKLTKDVLNHVENYLIMNGGN
ncbi:MAG: hypothetical protein LBE83_10795 [Propionibacteriaceae bacterium]|jgi:hypothetical protein|nr:hypothetical protein [Propionibacteriaceae bacterium]